MRIAIGSDHRGFDKKNKIKKYLQKKKIEVVDYGTLTKEMTDFPQYAIAVSTAVANKEVDYGILICATGIGMSIAANKVKGIRCAKLNTIAEAKHAKIDNNANVLAFSNESYMFLIKDMIDAFMKETPSEVERYKLRNEQIERYESK